MPRLSIDITPHQHQRLKAVAALSGQSIKDFVLSRTLEDIPDVADLSDHDAMEALAAFLRPRFEQAVNGNGREFEGGELLGEIKARRKTRHAKT